METISNLSRNIYCSVDSTVLHLLADSTNFKLQINEQLPSDQMSPEGLPGLDQAPLIAFQPAT